MSSECDAEQKRRDEIDDALSLLTACVYGMMWFYSLGGGGNARIESAVVNALNRMETACSV
ncbi:MAG: hypothetical protein EHM72_12195 [Calditrichaeota bacterium]|nr:MAG: hypothetical protein EHM72_12195 [Calditrichota bacterium]